MAIRYLVAWTAAFGCACAAVVAQSAVLYLSHQQARPIFEALNEPPPGAGDWPRWIAETDRKTRARVREGDETSIVNLLLFGTSFTREPRITSGQIDQRALDSAVSARLGDFERALARPALDERLLFAREVLGETAPVGSRMRALLEWSIEDARRYARLAEQAQALEDPRLQFAERSTIYRTRGLSSDTSLRTNFAVEQALKMAPLPRPLRRVAIVGPGLDFVDKQEGYDFYPVQTIQPFAVAGSLIDLGLAGPESLQITTLDLNARVNAHIERARQRARDGAPYVLYLLLERAVRWTPEFVAYWKSFGSAIGRPIEGAELAAGSPTPSTVMVRSIGVTPDIVQRVQPIDLNISAQYLALSDTERFDLIVATNVFVYYDRLQQALALAAVANMLRPGGVLLSNNALVEVPANGLRFAGYSRTLYSDRAEDGDLIIWYVKPAG